MSGERNKRELQHYDKLRFKLPNNNHQLCNKLSNHYDKLRNKLSDNNQLRMRHDKLRNKLSDNND